MNRQNGVRKRARKKVSHLVVVVVVVVVVCGCSGQTIGPSSQEEKGGIRKKERENPLLLLRWTRNHSPPFLTICLQRKKHELKKAKENQMKTKKIEKKIEKKINKNKKRD